MNRNYDITAIEEAVKAIVRELNVSERVYCDRPRSIEDKATDFVVVKVTGMVRDMGTFARCAISVSLFAKDVNNLKNSKKLSVMQLKMTEGFPSESGHLMFRSIPRILGDTQDDFGFHARVIQFNNVLIKSV